MPDYQKMYLTLFNAITNAIKNLQDAQIAVEEIYMAEAGEIFESSDEQKGH